MSAYSCRPTPVTYCETLPRLLGGARIYVKREDLNHTGAHKVNNVMGQGLLVKRMGKRRVIAETGAGQHGVATATMAARLGLACTIYMGEDDIARQRPNVFWMEQLGAGGGSNASGIFAGFLDDASVELVGVEAGGKGVDTEQHAARLAGGRGCPGVAPGDKSGVLPKPQSPHPDT